MLNIAPSAPAPYSRNIVAIPYRQLLRDPDVLFAGYKVPHPLEYEIILKVRVGMRGSTRLTHCNRILHFGSCILITYFVVLNPRI